LSSLDKSLPVVGIGVRCGDKPTNCAFSGMSILDVEINSHVINIWKGSPSSVSYDEVIRSTHLFLVPVVLANIDGH